MLSDPYRKNMVVTRLFMVVQGGYMVVHGCYRVVTKLKGCKSCSARLLHGCTRLLHGCNKIERL